MILIFLTENEIVKGIETLKVRFQTHYLHSDFDVGRVMY